MRPVKADRLDVSCVQLHGRNMLWLMVELSGDHPNLILEKEIQDLTLRSDV